MIHLKVPISELHLTTDEILNEIGYRNSLPAAAVICHIEELLNHLNRYVTGQYSFELFNGTLCQEQIYLTSGTELQPGATLLSLLEGASSFAVFVATLGSEFEAYVSAIRQEGDTLRSFLIDTIGSYAVERIGDLLEGELESRIDGALHTHRFSPGYCGWQLSQQAEIFRLLSENSCGITLSESFLMSPLKSISGIIGIGDTVKRGRYGCAICIMENCYKRKNRKK